MNIEEIIMQIIAGAGNARSYASEAIRDAREGRFEDAQEKRDEAAKATNEAHKAQMDLLVEEANGNNVPISLLMVHAQDYIMNALTVCDLAAEMIENMKQNKK